MWLVSVAHVIFLLDRRAHVTKSQLSGVARTCSEVQKSSGYLISTTS